MERLSALRATPERGNLEVPVRHGRPSGTTREPRFRLPESPMRWSPVA